MKLYAKIHASDNKRIVSKASNDVLVVELYNGNHMQGILALNCDSNELVYSKLENNAFIPVYREKLKAKM